MEFLCLSVSLFPSVPSLSTFFPAITKVDVSVPNKTACSAGIFWTMSYHHLAIMHSFCYIIHFSHSSESHLIYFQSVSQFSRSVVSDSLRPCESPHARPPCPSPTPGVHSDSRPSSQWCHPAISFSVVPFSSCPQSLPASESFPMSQLFAWGGQSTGVSALVSFLPKKSQISFRMDWLDLLAVQGTLKSLLQHHSSKASILWCSVLFTVQLSRPYLHPVNFGFPSYLCHHTAVEPLSSFTFLKT